MWWNTNKLPLDTAETSFFAIMNASFMSYLTEISFLASHFSINYSKPQHAVSSEVKIVLIEKEKELCKS